MDFCSATNVSLQIATSCLNCCFSCAFTWSLSLSKNWSLTVSFTVLWPGSWLRSSMDRRSTNWLSWVCIDSLGNRARLPISCRRLSRRLILSLMPLRSVSHWWRSAPPDLTSSSPDLALRCSRFFRLPSCRSSCWQRSSTAWLAWITRRAWR